MATFQPTDEDIETFLIMVPDLNRSQVIARLKGNNNNVDQAVNEYFDNLNAPNKYDWDETAFEADRNGLSTTQGPEFNIQAPDDTGPFGGQFDGGPSRPPSRISNNRFPRADAPPPPPAPYDHNDRDLHQALAASRAEAGLPPQETGTTGTEQAFFGPANRSQYEAGKWELVPTGNSSSREIIQPNPDPAERKRDAGVPAFLKPSIDDHRLGALLTIYHQIPLVREILLNRKDVLHGYGSNNEWWTGRPIELPPTNEPEDPTREVGQEMQRLMAFLDKTERSYGSADALANMLAVKRKYRGYEGMEIAVMKAYRELLEESDASGAIKKLFSVGVDGSESGDSEEFSILKMDLPSKHSEQETLYDIADAALWNPESLELSGSPYLSHIGDVIAFQLCGNSSSKGVEIPAIWYPDRYLESSRQAALDMRRGKRDVNETLRQIDAQEERLTNYTILGKGKVKVQDLFKAVLQHDMDQVKDDTVPISASDAEEGLAPEEQSAKSKKLSAEVHKLMTSIDQKLISLNQEREKARDTLRELSKLYTEPSTDPTQPTLHKYTLRGISTTKNTMYICTQAEPDLIELESDQSKPNGDQWWKIVYSAYGTSRVSIEKMTEQAVLEAAKTYKYEDSSSLLVYASEKAMSWDRQPLPKALETFVRYDNALFKSEFPSDVTSPISPGKRKFDSSSEDSLESARFGSAVSGATGGGGEGTVNILDRDIGGAELEEGAYGGGQQQPEVILGIDPFQDGPSEDTPRGQEMQERKSMRMLSSRPKRNAEEGDSADSMDLDHIVQDHHVAEESGAVKSIGSNRAE